MESAAMDTSSGPSDASASSSSVPGSLGSVDQGKAEGAESNRQPANDNGKPVPNQPEEPKWHKEKIKLKRGGAEKELTAKEALAMLDDDYEHEIPVSGETRKAKYQDLVRGFQKAGGAENLMRQAAEQRKMLEAQTEFGRNNVPWMLENVLGVENHEDWALNVVRQMYQRDKELTELNEKDPSSYHARMQKMVEDKLNRKNAFAEAQRKQQEAIQQQRMQREQAELSQQQAVKAAGLPWNRTTKALLSELTTKYRELGYQPSTEELVHEARQEYIKEALGFVDQHDDDKLLELLGKERRERLRKLELAKSGVKQQPKEQPQQQPAPRAPRTTEISEAEFLRSTGGRR